MTALRKNESIPGRLEPLVPLSDNGTPLRGSAGSARRWIWRRRGYGRTVKVFWDLRTHPETWRGLEWRTSNDGRMYAARVRRASPGMNRAHEAVDRLAADKRARWELEQRGITDIVAERDRYRQALIDIAGHENWEPKTMGDIARDALDPERRKEPS